MPNLGQECECQSFGELAMLVAAEATYSDDATTPVLADAVLLTGAPTLTVLGDKLSRDVAKPFWGNDADELVGRFVQIEGEVEVVGAGVAGDLPAIANLLRCCGLAETQEVGVKATYDPASENIPSNTIYFHRAKDLWKIRGVRGDMSLSMQSKQYAKYKFKLVGLFALPEDNESLPAINISDFEAPLVLNYQNTPTADFFGHAVDVESLEFSMGNDIEMKDKPGCYAVSISNRKPTASITMCAPRISDLDIRGKADANELGVVEIVHGTTAGKIFGLKLTNTDIDLSGVQDTQIGTNEKGISVPLMPLPITGDDEFQLTFK